MYRTPRIVSDPRLNSTVTISGTSPASARAHAVPVNTAPSEKVHCAVHPSIPCAGSVNAVS